VDITQLPYIDEHSIDIALDVDDTWPFLLDRLEGSFSHRAAQLYARALRCTDTEPAGPRPFAVGSSIPGFHVAAIEIRSTVVLVGHHRFSDYALVFRLERLGPHRTRVHAETRAAFPGAAGRIYRLVVIGSGGHVVAVRRMLSGVKRQAEAFATAAH